MSGFDWIIAAIVLVSVLVGIFRGFIKESLSLISWILAIWLAFTFCVEAGEFLSQYIDIPNQKFRTWAGFALVFVGTLFLFAVISFVLAKLFVRGPIKGIDRVLGIGFGAVRGGAIVVAFLIVARGLGMTNSDWWQNSKYLPYFLPASHYVEGLFPQGWQSDNLKDSGLGGKVLEQGIEQLSNEPEKE